MTIGVFERAEADGLERIRYPVPGGRVVEALYIHPDETKKVPAVIFNHGAIVEYKGLDGAKKLGYDLESYLAALAESGFAGIAPIRTNEPGLEASDILTGCARYLESRPNIDRKRLGMAGFSKGGAITYMTAGSMDLKAVVLISPAGAHADNEDIAKRIRSLKMPVFLTLGDQTDNKEIIAFCTRTLIPAFEKSNKNFTYKTGYPGDHKWFWKMRREHWRDVEAFLKKYL